MPLNQIKAYNDLLEVNHLSPRERDKSLRGIFNRDIVENENFSFRGKFIYPTTKQGVNPMEQLYWHLTTSDRHNKEGGRQYVEDRSVRLHWIKYHIEEYRTENMLVFKVDDENRAYILDKDERYVIILDLQRKKEAYYLITAYPLKAASYKKIMKKYERRGSELI